MMEKSATCLHKNLVYIREHYPLVAEEFLRKLSRFENDLIEHKEWFAVKKSPGYPDHANSDAWMIGKARYKDHDEVKAANHEVKYGGPGKKIKFDTDEISAVITYKGKKLDDRSMAREELELEIPDAEVGKTLLQRIGFYSVPVLEKKRWYFRRNEMTACVDQVTGLGDYLELEIMVETEAEREGALQRIENVLVSLGYSMKDTTRHSYLSMLTDQTCAMEVAHEHYI